MVFPALRTPPRLSISPEPSGRCAAGRASRTKARLDARPALAALELATRADRFRELPEACVPQKLLRIIRVRLHLENLGRMSLAMRAVEEQPLPGIQCLHGGMFFKMAPQIFLRFGDVGDLLCPGRFELFRERFPRRPTTGRLERLRRLGLA